MSHLNPINKKIPFPEMKIECCTLKRFDKVNRFLKSRFQREYISGDLKVLF